MHKLKALVLISIFSLSTFFGVGVLSQSVYAAAGDASKSAACTAIGDISPGDTSGCSSSAGSDVNKLIELALNLLSIAAGIIAVIMLIIAGLSYITSDGDSTKISHAKSTLIYAIIGLVVVVFAQLIVQFVLTRSIQSQDSSTSQSQIVLKAV